MTKIELGSILGKPDMYYPVFVCDHCGDRIDDVSAGMCHWRKARNGQLADEAIKMYHKRPCSDVVQEQEQQSGECSFLWHELSWMGQRLFAGLLMPV